MFDLIANIMAFFYAIWPSYAAAIVLLTVTVMVVFTPLTIKSTKSMLEMRRVQPEIKKVQAKYKDDRVKLNEEMMKLYQEHSINPLGGCLPMLFQLPVFFVMFQVLRGLTRRTSSLGYAVGNIGTQAGENATTAGPGAGGELELAGDLPQKFNPEFISEGSDLYHDLSNSFEMNWLGMDLSQSASKMLSISVLEALPYLFMILIVAVLGWYQQRQIQGRNPDASQNPQQQMIMKVMPFFLPIISFTMQAALVLYFIASSTIRVGQQAWITKRVYAPIEAKGPIEAKVLDESDPGGGDEPAEAEDPSPRAAPKGLSAILGGKPAELLGGKPAEEPSNRKHGRRRPTTAPAPKPKATPPKANAANSKSSKTGSSDSEAKPKAGSSDPTEAPAGEKQSWWRRPKAEPKPEAKSPGQAPSRVTPKGEQKYSSTKKKRKKRK
jgi:YidC/Oxa1 family membrane protein insertase